MSVWRAAESGDRVHFHDEVLDLAVLVFTHEQRIFAEVVLTGLAVPEPHHLVLGPFAHFAAVTDAISGYLIRIEADEDDGVFKVVRVPDADVPAAPAVPAARAFSPEMMSPNLAAELVWEAQQLLDTGLDPTEGVRLLETGYHGERYDPQSASEYAGQCSLDLLKAVTAAPPPTDARANPAIAEASGPVQAAVGVPTTSPVVVDPGPALAPEAAPAEHQPAVHSDPNPPMSPPAVLAPIATQPRLGTLVVAPVAAVGTGAVTNMPRAAIPRANPFVPVDWSTLPVHVVEERLSQELVLLRASMRSRRARALV